MDDKKTVILHVVSGMNRGGVETFLMNVYKSIDREKYQFLFLCHGNDAYDYESDVNLLGGEIIRIPRIGIFGAFAYYNSFREVLIKKDVKIIHSHTFYNSMFPLIVGYLNNIKTRIVHSHNTKSEINPNILKKLYFYLSKLFISHLSTHKIACGRDAGRALFNNRSFDVINNGIVLSDFKFNLEDRDEIRKALGIQHTTRAVLHVGRFDEQKNHKGLIDIYSKYTKSHSDSAMILVGDGPLRSSIQEMVKTEGLSKKVYFLGKRGDLSKLYSAADVFLLPSLYEGLPVVLVEAQANGLMCIVSDTVDSQSKLTDNIKFAPIDGEYSEWMKALDKVPSRNANVTVTNRLRAYDVQYAVEQLNEIYSS